MRRVQNYRINRESIEDMIKWGRFNPSFEITFRDKAEEHKHKLSAGYSDTLDIFQEGPEIYVLSTNARFGYVGLEVFEGAEKIGDIFLEGYRVKEVLGNERLSPCKTVKRLRGCIG